MKSGLSAVKDLATGIVDSISGIVTEVAGAADELLTTAVNSGMSVETLTKLRYAANSGYDVDVNSITGAVTKLRRGGLNDAMFSEAGSLVEGANRVVDPETGRSRAATAEETFWAVMNRMNSYYRTSVDENGNLGAGDMARMDEVMNKLFGKSFTDLMTLVVDPEGLWDRVNYGERSGMVVNEREMNVLGGLDDLINTIKANVTAIKERFVLLFGDDFAAIFASIKQFTEGVMKLMRALGAGDEEGATNAIGDIRTALGNIGTTILNAIKTAWEYIKTGLRALSEETDPVTGEKTTIAKIATWLLELPDKLSDAWTKIVEFFTDLSKVMEAIAKFLGLKDNPAEEAAKANVKEINSTPVHAWMEGLTTEQAQALAEYADIYADNWNNSLRHGSGDMFKMWGAEGDIKSILGPGQTFDDFINAIQDYALSTPRDTTDITLPAEWFTESITNTRDAVTKTPEEVESGASKGAEAGIRAGLKGVRFNVYYDINSVSERVAEQIGVYM